MLRGSASRNWMLSLPAFVLALLLATLTSLLSPSFLTDANLANLANRALPLGLVALGEAIVLFAGRIDLSVGATMSLATALMATLSPTLGWLAVPPALGAGALAGAVTAFGVFALRINPLIMSLATGAIIQGAALLVLPSPGGEVDYAFYALLFEADRLLGPALFILVACYALATLAMGWTRPGRVLYAFGSDAHAAFANGIATSRVDLSAYVLSGLLAAAAGVILSIRILSGDPLIGVPYTLDAVAAAILGGVALSGGRGAPLGVLFAAVSLVFIGNMFNLLDLDTNLQAIVRGLIFILALVFFMRGKAAEGVS
ncbi:ABC transporter permease [Consotaella aegiceratis]|uniref:ABC transporter permease n=1 Tax=Consotaella aegiceratis TaxID=3097961 RepID=UPI002F4062FF